MTDFLYPRSSKFALANCFSIDSMLEVLDLSKMRMSILRVALVTLELASVNNFVRLSFTNRGPANEDLSFLKFLLGHLTSMTLLIQKDILKYNYFSGF